MEYNPSEIEATWQQYWQEQEIYRCVERSDKPKYYVLDMFPYPSGAGLHVGHPLGYIASDIVARYKRHQGYNVLHPMGYDSFGLPAEQYAIQTGQHPAKTTRENIARYRQQLDQMGFCFDWSREVRTSDPQYYRWTQFIFLQFFQSWYDYDGDRARDIKELEAHFEKKGTENLNSAQSEELRFSAEDWKAYSANEKEEVLQNYRLAYRSESTVNWCPALGTVLANDEVKEGKSERGGHPVVQKKMMQWSMRITAFAERLLAGLDTIDWSESLKEAQRNWIGKSEGAALHFDVKDHDAQIEVFTTRPDTIFGVSFMVLAPEHSLVDKLTTDHYRESVEEYRRHAAQKSERERMADVKTVSGQFTGAYAIHPFTKKEIPIWIGDYVLASYGTGAVMAVPAHDSRDWAFAGEFRLHRPQVVEGGDVRKGAIEAKEGTVINSDFLNGLPVEEAITRAIEEIEKRGIGKGKINYRLRDAIFGRQRYWGEPIPVYYEGGIPHPVKEKHLPLELPEVDKYLPTEEGEPPLARAAKWNYDPEKGVVPNGEGFPLETTTMPGWAGSSWYDLRYMDPHNERAPFSKEAQRYWQDVDLYIGGSEHATGHLLYTRFWHKAFKDWGWIDQEEPFKKLINQGMILGNSAFVLRDESDPNLYISRGLKNKYHAHTTHVDVNMVNLSDELDTESFRKWRDDLSEAKFVKENEKVLVKREVEKMSKSKFNVVNPDDVIREYGADTLRLYEMFLGPIEQSKPWNTAGLSGVYGFLKKLWKLYHREGEFAVTDEKPNEKELKSLHTLIKKIREDIANYSFNTSVSAFMICTNELNDLKCAKRGVLEVLPVLLSPFAPHLAEELWSRLGNSESVVDQPFPEHVEEYLQESSFEYPISFNGKVRFKCAFPADKPKAEIEKEVLNLEKTQGYLQGQNPKKIIVVPGKIVNIVY